MALINCSECGKEISDKATSCPNCGNPINQIFELGNSEKTDYLHFPNLPVNLEIGKQITNWVGNAVIEGIFDQNENTNTSIPSGKVNVLIHTHGLQVTSDFYIERLKIHHSQIISLKQTSKEELLRKDKSVIGRAVVGGLILGPLGAIVGGMSGIGNKDKFVNKHYLIINYWDIESKTAQSLLISGDRLIIQAFIKRHEKEKLTNETENRIAEENKAPIGMYIFILAVIIIIVIIILQ